TRSRPPARRPIGLTPLTLPASRPHHSCPLEHPPILGADAARVCRATVAGAPCPPSRPPRHHDHPSRQETRCSQSVWMVNDSAQVPFWSASHLRRPSRITASGRLAPRGRPPGSRTSPAPPHTQGRDGSTHFANRA